MYTHSRKLNTPLKNIYSDKLNDSVPTKEIKTPSDKSTPLKEKKQSTKEWKEILDSPNFDDEYKALQILNWSNETINKAPFSNTSYFIKNSLESKYKIHEKFLSRELRKLSQPNNPKIQIEFLNNITKIQSALSLWKNLEKLEREDNKKIESIKKYIFTNQGHQDIFITISNVHELFARCLVDSFTKEIAVAITIVEYFLAPFYNKFNYSELLQDLDYIPWFINDNLVSFVSNLISQTIDSINRESSYLIENTFRTISIVLNVLSTYRAALTNTESINRVDTLKNRLLRLIGSSDYLSQMPKKPVKKDLLELMKTLLVKYSKEPQRILPFEEKFLELSKKYKKFDALFEWAEFILQGNDLNQSKIYVNFIQEFPQEIHELFKWLLMKGKHIEDNNRVDDKSFYFKALSFAQQNRYDISDLLKDEFQHLQWIHFLGTENENKYSFVSRALKLEAQKDMSEEKSIRLENLLHLSKACFMSPEDLREEKRKQMEDVIDFSSEEIN